MTTTRDHLLQQTAQRLWEDGVCVIENVVSPSLLAKCLHYLREHDPRLIDERDDPRKNYVSDRRHYCGVEPKGPFACREALLPADIEQVLIETLGPSFMFDAWGFIVSYPGAPAQHWHRDGGVLFPGHPLEFMLPASAVTLVIPLVEMNGSTGTTGFQLKSHRTRDLADRIDYEPVVKLGSAILWDYRIWHLGMANKSAEPRPLITATLCRPWWQDVRNYVDNDKLLMSRVNLEGLDEELQRRFSRARLLQ